MLFRSPLDRNAREAVWRRFLDKVSTTKGAADFTKKDLDILVEKDLNGWEVRVFAPTVKPS